jgi:glyoxylase-like metal-dependent hydrolase (beta-lactamase superfamily II)
MTDIEFNRDFTARPGSVVRISPLIRRVLCDNPGPFTFKGTSTFIVGHGAVAIIDPGPGDDAHLGALLKAVENETVTHILITHTHVDHSALAARLKALTGAITCGYGPHGAASGTTRVDASADRHFAPDIAFRHGDRIRGPGWTIEGVFTPGHTSNHMAYALEEEKALFCGDHVMAWATSVIAPPDGNMGQYLNSLRLLLERPEDVYYPTHGPSPREPRSLVRAYLAHRRMREEAILARLGQGDRSIGEIVRANYADLDPRLEAAAALTTLAHLEHLIEQGRVETEGAPSLESEYRLRPRGNPIKDQDSGNR